MTTSVVLGANGQDGTFLVRRLAAEGHRVVGVGLERASNNNDDKTLFEYRTLDIRRDKDLASLLSECQPDRVFHLAAVHASAAENTYEPVFGEMLSVNVGSVHTVLEFLRTIKPESRLLYASSGKVFGDPPPASVDEGSPRSDSCLYSLTKNAAGSLIEHYRRTHKAQASVVYLFNHESEYRPPQFFIPKLLTGLLGALGGRREKQEFLSLDFYCDWGSAEEYMDIAVELLNRAPGEDFVLATGHCVYARDLARRLYESHGLDIREHVLERHSSPASARAPYKIDLTKLQRFVGRKPEMLIGALLGRLLERLRNRPTVS